MKIGILGAGGIAVQMAKTVAGMKDVENYAVAARSFERRRLLPRNTVFPRLMALMRKCLQTRRWIWFILQPLIPIIIFMQRCAWRQEKMCFVKRRLL